MTTEDLDKEQMARVAALDCVQHMFRGTGFAPAAPDFIAMAQWVETGSAEFAETILKEWGRPVTEFIEAHEGRALPLYVPGSGEKVDERR